MSERAHGLTNEERMAVIKLFYALLNANEIACAVDCMCSKCSALNLAELTFGEGFFE